MKKFLAVLLVLSLLAASALIVIADEKAIANEAKAAMADVSMKVNVNAKAAVLMEANTGRVLMASKEHDKLFPASVTKIMSMLLVCEALDEGRIKLSDNVVTTETAASKGGSQIWLKVGESMSVNDLLKATAVYSANDACTLLGEHVAGSDPAFVDLMNKRAGELGMNDTHFDNCTGLDDATDSHLTSAYDIALMSRELLKHELIIKYSKIWMDSVRGGATELVNTNKLIRTYNGITGLKTGTTNKAGYCVSATAERDGLSLISVVLGGVDSKSRFDGARAMLDWGFANYESVIPEVDMSAITDVKVLHGLCEIIAPVLPEITPIITLKGSGKRISQKVTLAADVEAPVEKGQVLGKIEFYLDEELIGEYNLLSGDAVGKMSFGDAFMKILRSFALENAQSEENISAEDTAAVQTSSVSKTTIAK